MRICFLSQALPYLPSRGGFRLYGANLMRHLSQRHNIELISLLEDGDEDHLDWPRQYCSDVLAVPKVNANIVRRLANVSSGYLWGRPLVGAREIAAPLQAGVASGRWDVLHVEGAYAGGLVPVDLPIPKVLSLHDSWTLRCAEMLKCSQTWREKLHYMFLKYYEPRYERLVYPRFDACTVVAAPDLEEVRKIVPRARIDLIPYGTDTQYFHPLPVEKQAGVLVFHSHLGYAPNIEAALEFSNDVLPLIRREVPTAVFHLVGASPSAKIQALASRPGIRISADLPDLRAAVCSGQVYVSAIRHGTGLKSKILEAMAMGMPIVCYPGSTVGIEAVPGHHLLVAHSAQEFAASVLKLLCNPGRAEEIAQAGRRLVKEKYSWESRACTYEVLYEQARQLHHPGSQLNLPLAFVGRT
jgi:glycosyltransferase involved in cell wall biosynthesis